MRLTVVLTITFSILWLEPVSAIKKLHNMIDLTSTKFGTKFPNNGLMLLYWFTLHTSFPDELTMKPDGFDPTRGDYGCRKYSNPQKIFPYTTEGETYYIIGGLNHVAAKFPSYVYQDYYNADCNVQDGQYSTSQYKATRSQDRIIFRLKKVSSALLIRQVYITQTTESGLRLKHDLTFEVTPHLLREISDIYQQKTAILCPSSKANEEKANRMFEDHKLVWFLILAEYDVSLRELCLSRTHCSDSTEVGEDCLKSLHCTLGNNYDEVCDWNPMSLTVGSTKDGHAIVKWVNIPDTKVGNSDLMVALFQNDQSTNILAEKSVDGLATGSFSTKIRLDAGLQVRLLLKPNETLWRGRELDDANGKMPVKLSGYDASFQLFARNGKGCARFYVEKSFTNWRSTLHQGYSYICYHSYSESSCHYYVYLKNMVETAGHKSAEFDVYEYCFAGKMTPLTLVKFTGYSNKLSSYYTVVGEAWGN